MSTKQITDTPKKHLASPLLAARLFEGSRDAEHVVLDLMRAHGTRAVE